MSCQKEISLRSFSKFISFAAFIMGAGSYSLVFGFEGQAWQEPEPINVTGMALAHCILGKFLGVVCHCFPSPLDVPTFSHQLPLSAMT